MVARNHISKMKTRISVWNYHLIYNQHAYGMQTLQEFAWTLNNWTKFGWISFVEQFSTWIDQYKEFLNYLHGQNSWLKKNSLVILTKTNSQQIYSLIQCSNLDSYLSWLTQLFHVYFKPNFKIERDLISNDEIELFDILLWSVMPSCGGVSLNCFCRFLGSNLTKLSLTEWFL